MNILSRKAGERFLKTLSVLTAVTTVLSLSGVAYLAYGASPADYGLKEGDLISAAGSDDPDVYIVNEHGYKRLFLNPQIFNLYGHLGGFSKVKNVSPATRDAFVTSGLFRVDGDEKVYGLETTGEDVANLRWVNTSGAQAVADDANFFKKVFVINAAEKALYGTGANFTSVNQVPAYTRGGSVPAATGPVSVSLAAGNPSSATITRNATGVEYMRLKFSGNGTVNTVTFKRLGPGLVADFGNVYIYDGAKRLTSGKTFSSSDGAITFLLNVPVNGSKELSVVADMSTATVGDVNYVQLSGLTLAGGASASGAPLSGNNFTISGATSGRLDVALSGSLSDPTVGQKGALLSQFKLTANTEGATVKRLTMINGGTLKPADLSNLWLETLTGEKWSGVSTTDGYVVFDLGAGHFIAKGGNAVFKVSGDVAGKKSETVDLYFESAADLYAVGNQYGQGMNTASGVTNQGIDALDTAAEATTLTLQGGAVTLVFNGPSATTIGTTVSDATFLRYSVTAAANIEAKKHELVLCVDTTGNGTFDNAADETEWDELTDVKVWDESLNTVVIGPKDGTAFDDTNDTASCPDSATGAQETFTDTIDWAAGKTYNYKVTADVDTSLGGNLTGAGSIIRIVLDDYSDDAGDVTVMKYSGTNTSVAAADIVPRADISGANITLAASSLTLSLAGAPSDQTKIRGTKDVNAVGVTFAAGQASALKVTTIKITGYANDNGSSETTFDEGVSPGEDTAVSVANAMAKVQLYEAESGTLIAGSDKVTSNLLGTSGTGTMTFSNLNWNIPSGTSKTMLVRVDLSNNTASGTAGDDYAFDVAATGDVTALDVDNRTVNAGNAGVNGTTSPTQVLTIKNSGSMTLAASSDSPQKAALYWGQNNATVSKFRLSATDEGQYMEKLTIAASDSTEATHAKNNVKTVYLTYKNKAGQTLTKSQAMGNAASVNFNWSTDDANRPYVPQDSALELTVSADLKTKSEGATPTNASPATVYFSLDLVDKYNGSHADGFRAVGDGSGTVIDGTSSGINDVLGSNDQYLYRVYPKVEQVALAAPYNLLGNPTVFKFSVTAMGLPDATLRFDNENVGSGSFKFEIVASGEYTVGGAAQSSSFTIYDEGNVTIDTATSEKDAEPIAPRSSLTFNFSSRDVEISGGQTKTFRVQFDNPSTNYSKTSTTGRAADYFQLMLLDDEAGLINWVADYNNATTAIDTASTVGTIRSLPLYGPTFQR